MWVVDGSLRYDAERETAKKSAISDSSPEWLLSHMVQGSVN